MIRRGWWTLLLAASVLSPTFAAERVRVADLEVERGSEAVEIAYRLEGTIPDDVVERLRAGISVTFRHRVDLVVRGAVLIAPNRLADRREIETTATYDSLTKQYTLERVVRSGDPDRVGPPAIERRTTDDVEAVRAWMTEVSGVTLSLAGLSAPEIRRGRVRVSSVLGRRYVLWVFPASISAGAEAELPS